MKRANHIFVPRQINARLAANAAVHLGKKRRRNLHEGNAAQIVAAANPQRSPTTPPPSAASISLRSKWFKIRVSYKSRTVSRFLCSSPAGNTNEITVLQHGARSSFTSFRYNFLRSNPSRCRDGGLKWKVFRFHPEVPKNLRSSQYHRSASRPGERLRDSFSHSLQLFICFQSFLFYTYLSA